MRKDIPAAPKPTSPVMMDRALAYIQDTLIEKIGWLNHAFGRAQRLVTTRERNNYFYPAVYIGSNEYLNVLPGQGLGNRTFFMVEDPQTIEYNPRRYNLIKCPVSLVLWYDLKTIYPDSTERNTEEIKGQMLRVLTNMTMPNGSRFELSKMYEQAENIFKGYSLKEVDTQYLMNPYSGIRFEALLTYREDCNND